VRLAKERNAYGFFYQEHTNTYQIVGFYDSPSDMTGDYVSHGHARGLIGTLSSSCPAPARFDENTVYPVHRHSSDNYYNYCNFITAGTCYKDFCESSLRSACKDECEAAEFEYESTQFLQ